jgi:predicted nucleic acid-binding protein
MKAQPQCTTSHREDSGAFRVPLHAPYRSHESYRIAIETLLQTLEQSDSEIIIAPLDQPIGLAVQQIDRDIIPEMPDRIIAATALHLNCPLVTRDHKIQTFSGITTIW